MSVRPVTPDWQKQLEAEVLLPVINSYEQISEEAKAHEDAAKEEPLKSLGGILAWTMYVLEKKDVPSIDEIDDLFNQALSASIRKVATKRLQLETMGANCYALSSMIQQHSPITTQKDRVELAALPIASAQRRADLLRKWIEDPSLLWKPLEMGNSAAPEPQVDNVGDDFVIVEPKEKS